MAAGAPVLYPLKQGEPVLRSKVTGPGQRASLAAVLEDGKRAVTVRVDDVRGVAGFVLPGDYVDIVMIADEYRASAKAIPTFCWST
jgi:Flp pilus assembly protein CpaB